MPAQQLARKIVAFTGPGTVAFSVQNRSSLTSTDVDTIAADLRLQLEALGVHTAEPERAAGSVAVCLSENLQAYVWVAEMQIGSQSGAVMVSTERAEGSTFSREQAGVTIRKIPLWAQVDRILDVVVLEEDSAPKHIAVLDAEKVALYRRQNTKWQQERFLESHRAAVAAGYSRKIACGEGSFAGRLSARSLLPHHRVDAVYPGLPRKR